MSRRIIFERYVWFDNQTRQKKYPNASKLAAQFELSVKTAQRDIEFMRDRINCPLLYDKNQKGYFYKNNAFSLPLTYLSPEELTALLFAQKVLHDLSGGKAGDEITAILQKITSILQQNVPDKSVENAVSLQLIGNTPAPQACFTPSLEACLKKKCLAFNYYSPASEKETARTVDPYHLVNYMGTWHLIAWCHDREDLRDFVLARMKDTQVLDEAFSVPANFDSRKHLQSAFGIFKGKPKGTVTLRFSPRKSSWIKGQAWHKDQKERYLKDGSLELTFPVSSFAEIMMVILSHGSDVEVIKPKALRTLIKEEAKRIAHLY